MVWFPRCAATGDRETCLVVLATGLHNEVIHCAVITLLYDKQQAYTHVIHGYGFPVVWQPAYGRSRRCAGNRHTKSTLDVATPTCLTSCWSARVQYP